MISIFDLFKIGIGPSSSHTVGPMKAAGAFLAGLAADSRYPWVAGIGVRLYGSLAFTGRGHCTDKAVTLGLAGYAPDTVDPDEAERFWQAAREGRRLRLSGGREIGFDPARDIVFDASTTLPRHSNALRFSARDPSGQPFAEETWYSLGGGFIAREGEGEPGAAAGCTEPFPFRSAEALLAMCRERRCSIAGLVLENETALRPRAEIERHLERVADAMLSCIDRGMAAEGVLPGGLAVRRRARALRERLEAGAAGGASPEHGAMEYVSLYAIAVNEENAAGRRVVTAPTNGGAGVVPAVLRYYRDHCPGASREGQATFLLVAAAIGALCKMNASISAAEVGCQGEIGVACAMAAAGLAAVLGGTNEQAENAAEMGIEHHLGMTCDPVGGLVQIPCIERNAFGAVKAINAAALALRGDGEHHVSLDQAIATMRDTGRDMQAKYKETALGGLAVNVPNC
ncbi:MAG: L-serine ammonia-lyase [Burkholderiales bacterium]|nr:L-serine ammonia-lyase [Burkholderiales bacterium]